MELDDIQDLVYGYSRLPHARFLFVRFGPAEQARNWLAHMAGQVTTADRRKGSSDPALNVALTWVGLAALGVTEKTLYSFPEEFRVGMAGRAEQLGDIDVNDPRHWEPAGPGRISLHAMVTVYAATENELDQRCRQVSDDLAGCGEVVYSQDGHRLRNDGVPPVGGNQDKPLSREHFGFVDGLSQPIVEGLKNNNVAERLPGQGVLQEDGTWRMLRAGEIILGYLDEENVQPACPTPATLARNGSYLVYRKLKQDVAAFRRLKAEQGKNYPGGGEALAAKMMGRWPDGTPLEPPGEREKTTSGTQNGAFTYADDLDGLGCPVGAHIRRVNPRDGFTARDKIVHRHRMLRRAIPYGSPLPEGLLDDDGTEERGLLFFCLCASIARQFEFVQSQWSNDGNSLGLGNDQDPLLSNARGGTNFTIPGSPPWFITAIPPLVTVRGGEYFFLPGRRALASLSTCAPQEPSTRSLQE
ncbi:MAG: Dyp-type peroxidase, partial [Pseudonocardiaceae bacterium]